MRLECRECGESFVSDVDNLSLSELKKAFRDYDFWVCNVCFLDEDEDDEWWLLVPIPIEKTCNQTPPLW